MSAIDAFCDDGGCLTRVNEDPASLTAWDYGHLTTPGAAYLAGHLGLPGIPPPGQ